ncbi:putative glycoside hydrolase [Schlegelella sp. S2-27]|uniref:Glycoside hydrolase n=1 Tax=Caldimonas mangrovi TaxID=2944811 RepID=A0ABT0YM30_9BURK|nr:putative glycoside hydrolase [Caldimonas mangrovi]MCM5679307.1 putative glycoside hydrolase [Caldimonas mangrovi]
MGICALHPGGQRRLTLIALQLGVAALAACGGRHADTNTETPSAPAMPSPASAPAPTPVGGTYVRPPGAAPLLGANIGAKHYDDPAYQQQLARLDTVILGFHPGWRGDTDGSKIRSAVVALKTLNPSLKVGQYTILNEHTDDPSKTSNHDTLAKLAATDWWLRDAVTGAQTQWSTSYGAYDINFTNWSAPDAHGERYPQWLARRNAQTYFLRVPEFDIWYFDNVMKHSRVRQANWRLDGHNVSSQDPAVAAAYRQGHALHWAAAEAHAPGRIQMGNVDNDLSYPEFKGRLSAAFLEGMMGASYSLEGRPDGWRLMMQRYFSAAAHLRPPALVGFNVHGSPGDWRFFRYAFTSCLLGDGQFSFTDPAVGYSSVPWFDEYEVAFGAPLDAPTLTAWSNGVHRRRFEHAMVLVNPNDDARSVQLEPGWRRLLARQDPAVNNGTPVSQLTLGPKEGLVLVRE